MLLVGKSTVGDGFPNIPVTDVFANRGPQHYASMSTVYSAHKNVGTPEADMWDVSFLEYLQCTE